VPPATVAMFEHITAERLLAAFGLDVAHLPAGAVARVLAVWRGGRLSEPQPRSPSPRPFGLSVGWVGGSLGAPPRARPPLRNTVSAALLAVAAPTCSRLRRRAEACAPWTHQPVGGVPSGKQNLEAQGPEQASSPEPGLGDATRPTQLNGDAGQAEPSLDRSRDDVPLHSRTGRAALAQGASRHQAARRATPRHGGHGTAPRPRGWPPRH
jgi:hypothetical protein